MLHAYLAPEQIAGSGADHRADIFAPGALLYEMATGRPAFSGDTPAQIAAAITGRQPAHPRKPEPGVARRRWAGIIMRALAKEPDQRYQTAGELFEDLQRARRAAALLGRLPPRLRSRRSLIVAEPSAASWSRPRHRGWSAGRAAAGGRRATERSTVLVSHIANGTADPDFEGTLREAVTVYLAQSPYLDIVSDERMRGTLQLMGRDPSQRA